MNKANKEMQANEEAQAKLRLYVGGYAGGNAPAFLEREERHVENGRNESIAS